MLSTGLTLGVALAVGAAAMLFAAAGYSGASAYLGIFALLGFPPDMVKTASLVLNVIVGVVVVQRFVRAGHFRPDLFWPMAAGSVPLAFIGGQITLPGLWYRRVIGVIILYAAWRLGFDRHTAERLIKRPPHGLAALAGAAIGFAAGLIGMGGGVFFVPLVLLAGWASAHETAGTVAGFILINSAAGLAGHLAAVRSLPWQIFIWGAAVFVGGWLGAEWGAHRLGNQRMRQLIGFLLLLAGLRLLLMR